MRNSFDLYQFVIVLTMCLACLTGVSGAGDDEDSPGPLGDVIRRDDWVSARLRVGINHDGRVEYKEARLTSRDDLKRLASVLRKARHIKMPASYESDDNQAIEVKFTGEPEVTFTLFSPPKHIALGEAGSREYYEIDEMELKALFKPSKE